MPALFPFLPFDPAETPLSFATRLASFHIRSSVVPFLRDIGISPEALLGGEHDAVERLSAVAGVEGEALHRNAACRVAKRRFNLRGNVVSSEFFSSPYTVFCPACLREDDAGAADVGSARRGRLDWTLGAVRTCPRHGLALVAREKAQWHDKYHELARRVPERGDDLDRLIECAPEQTPSPLQVYVMQRLDGDTPHDWLDSQSLEQAVRATEMLGLLLEFGSAAQPATLGMQDWDRAGRTGFAVTSAGEAAIREALHGVQAEFRGKGGKPGGRKVFGALYEWLSFAKGTKDPGDIKRILREHIFDTMEIAGGTTVLGGPLAERRLHSVESLAAEARLHPKTLRNVLAANGLIPVEEKVTGHHVFDAHEGQKLANSIGRQIHVSALGTALNCTRPQAEQLLDEGLLRQISNRVIAAIGRTRKSVDSREVGAFLEKLHDCATVVQSVPLEMVPISKAAEKAKATSVDVLHLVLGGFLTRVVRLAHASGIAAIHVDPDEVRTEIGICKQGLRASEVFGRLNVSRSTGWALVLREDEPRIPSTIVVGRNGSHQFHRFGEDDVATFMARFATVPQIANTQNCGASELLHHLKKTRARPAIHRHEIGMDLYRIDQFPAPKAA
ncbi:MAG: TniQ family protein [Rhodobacteraceae bacterium]|nr:TniQ family protein [Paracoccaceae bacterium]